MMNCGPCDVGSAEGPDDEDLTNVMFEEDKAAIELELALKRARKVKVEKNFRPTENDGGDEKMDDLPPAAASSSSSGVVFDSGAAVIMNSTSELCRALGRYLRMDWQETGRRTMM